MNVMAAGGTPFDQLHLTGSAARSIRSFRRLWLARVDLEEAKATIDELLRLRLSPPPKDRPGPLLMALSTAMVVSYARPFIHTRGTGEFADRSVPGSILRSLTASQRQMHEELLSHRNKVIAHTDAELTEISLKVYPGGESAVLRVWNEPIRRRELQSIERMIKRIVKAIEHRCEELRSELPHNVWI